MPLAPALDLLPDISIFEAARTSSLAARDAAWAVMGTTALTFPHRGKHVAILRLMTRRPPCLIYRDAAPPSYICTLSSHATSTQEYNAGPPCIRVGPVNFEKPGRGSYLSGSFSAVFTMQFLGSNGGLADGAFLNLLVRGGRCSYKGGRTGLGMLFVAP